MATVIIGGRELRVWHRAEAGAMRRTKALLEAEIALREAKAAEVPDRMTALVLVYVEGNEGVDKDWLLDNLPADCGEILRACILATGGKVTDAGEASGPQKP